MLAVTRYRVPDADAQQFLDRARTALAALAARPGHVHGVVGRSTDDPGLWTLTTFWDSVGAYRRALSAYEVKLYAHPLMYLAVDEPTAFEPLVESDGSGALAERGSDRAPDADTIGLDDEKA
ncbi:antibiotic biosynthesis monooxygenase family protein [Aquipuribacter nitratireducens]|uniref:Antibiotic biosynthesis monooxygenase family protein n=1 Tax=Aquipuribacter nitratireducens TaxID=650104 RepID=A0ABW0GJB5_9MICO